MLYTRDGKNIDKLIECILSRLSKKFINKDCISSWTILSKRIDWVHGQDYYENDKEFHTERDGVP